ncbi:MAG TPA: hypothetical protein VNT51_00990 [Miltoncostaeaceae bacterium]|nr:hypothetical protein [Miltoncostaeaceae bacterium]
MFELVHGWSPPLVMHSCDTRGCVNPRHLLPGTPLANQSDMWAKGRGAWGEHHTNHKLTADQVRVMRAAAARGQASVRALAHAHGMTPEGVRAAISGKTWRHLAP